MHTAGGTAVCNGQVLDEHDTLILEMQKYYCWYHCLRRTGLWTCEKYTAASYGLDSASGSNANLKLTIHAVCLRNSSNNRAVVIAC